MIWKKVALLTAAVTLMGGLFTAPPAVAESDSEVAASRCTRNGKTGTFGHSCRLIVKASWGNEYFGVAPNRTIWHIWPGASKWWQMPGNGRANRVIYARTLNSGTREVAVDVGTGVSWCSIYLGGGHWSNWHHCL
jgi:hypothetical protein